MTGTLLDKYSKSCDAAFFDESAYEDRVSLFANDIELPIPQGGVKGKEVLAFGIKETLKIE